MRRRLLFVTVTIVCAVLAAVAVLGRAGVTAQEPDPEKVQAAAGTAFTYQGRLTDDEGAPLTGQYDFEFRLYDGSGGNAGQIGSAVTVNDKDVVDGRFTVELDFGANAFIGDARWLEIRVREGDSTGGFTQLLPRRELTPAPYAIGLMPGASIVGPVTDDGALTLDNSAGDGLRVQTVGRHGVNVGSAGVHGVRVGQSDAAGFRVDDAGNNGVVVRTAGDDGVNVRLVGDDGVHIVEAGSPRTRRDSTQKNGFVIEGAEGHGLWVGHANHNGVAVRQADDHGILVRTSNADGVGVGHGVYVESAGDDGLNVGSAGGNGVHVESAGRDGLHVDSAGDYGVFVESTGSHGVVVGSTGLDGVNVRSAARDGLHVESAGDYGIIVRNAGDDDDGIGVAGRFEGDVEVTGNLEVTGNVSKGSGSFRIDHPQDPEKMTLSHSFVESPEMMNVYNGNVTTDGDGFATVTLPDYFEALNTDYRYQLTVIGTFAQAIVAEEIEGNQFVIQTDEPHVKVSWQVTGVRNDPYAQANPIVVEEEKPAHERGLYLHPEAYGQPQEMGIGYAEAEGEIR